MYELRHKHQYTHSVFVFICVSIMMYMSVYTFTHTLILLPDFYPPCIHIDEISTNDLQVEYLLAGGPGGRSSRSHLSKVHLIHKPTKVQVMCKETRGLVSQ